MKEKLKLFKESLTETTTVSKREFLLMAAVCILGGIVLGILFSPRKICYDRQPERKQQCEQQ